MSPVVAPKAVRVRTSEGWVDLASRGPEGKVGGEHEMASVIGTADVSVTATAAASANTLLTLPSVTFDGATTVVLEFWSRAAIPPAGQFMAIAFYQDGVQIGSNAAAIQGISSFPAKVEARVTPTAGAKVFSVRAWNGAGTGTVAGGQIPAQLCSLGSKRSLRVLYRW